MTPTRTGPSNPRRGATPPTTRSRTEAGTPLEAALALLRGEAEADGLIAVSARHLAAELELSTIAARALVRRLVRDRRVVQIGRDTYALPGTPTAGSDGGDGAPPPRVSPHDAVHDGTGSPLLW